MTCTRLLSWLSAVLILLAAPALTLALDTSAGVGLQDRALFQDTVDYTLTNQSGKDFSGQQLANTSFAGAVGKAADFSGADLHGAILTQGAFPDANFNGADLSDVLLDRTDMSGTDSVLLGSVSHSGVQESGSAGGTEQARLRIDQGMDWDLFHHRAEAA